MKVMRALIVTGLVWIATVLSSCDANRGSGPRAAGDSRIVRERTIVASAWDTLWSVGGGERDSVLYQPFLIAASDSTVYVYDGGVQRVTALRAGDGRVRWRFGRKGAGPEEFRGVRDLKTTGGGDAILLDPRNNRIVQLNEAGRPVRQIPLDAVGHSEQLLEIGNDRFVLVTITGESPLAVLDGTGRVLHRFSLPSAEFARMDPIARQGYLAGRQGRWVYGYSMGDGWFAFDDVSPRKFTGRYVEHTEFPAVETTEQGVTKMAEYNACSACSMAVSDSLLYVHFGGHGEAPGQVVDRYRISDGTYAGSYRLPIRASVVEAHGDRIYLLAEEPYPVLLALRPRS